LLCMGSGAATGWPASGRGWQGAALLTSHHQGLGFRDFCRARGSQELMKKEEENCLPSPATRSGGRRKKNSVAQNDTVLPFFFFLHETTSFYTKRAVSFKCGAIKFFSNQSLIYPLFFLVLTM